MTPAAPHGNELYFLSFRITSRYIVTLDCTCNVRQKSNGLLKSSQSDDVKSLWISYHSIVSDGIGNGEKPSISKHFLASGVTSRWLIGSTPKRKVARSNRAGSAMPPGIFPGGIFVMQLFYFSTSFSLCHWVTQRFHCLFTISRSRLPWKVDKVYFS